MEKKTPLYDIHIKYGGKIVEFGGFLLPVQYGSGVKAEHMAVRTHCGLFDVSHMGEILVQGEKAKDYLNMLLTNDFTDLKPGGASYSPMCYENGGTVDDLIVYMRGENDYFLVVNAANTEKDFAWMCDHKIDGVELTNASNEWGQVALQGPNADKILHKIVDDKYIPAGYYTCIFDGDFRGIPVMISRTGYTGEDGFEIYMPADKAPEVWETLVEEGKDDGLIPCALGARDTLRLEAGMPLYGHEITEDISPKTSGLGFAITINDAKPIIEELIKNGYIGGRFRIGIRLIDMSKPSKKESIEEALGYELPEDFEGIYISEVMKDCDISNTALKAGDFITAINGKNVKTYTELYDTISASYGAGDTVPATCAHVDKNGNVDYYDIEFKLMPDTSGNY